MIVGERSVIVCHHGDMVAGYDGIVPSDRKKGKAMAEITSGDVVVMVLTKDEASKLGEVLSWVAEYDGGPWGSLDDLYEVLESFDIKMKG